MLHLAFATNGNCSGIEKVLGDSPDILHLLYFDIYQPVHYLEQVVAFPDDRQLLGRWLSPSHDVGQALCYWIMKPNGEMISRSTTKASTKSDIALDVRLAADIAAMDKQIAGKFGPFTKVVLEEDEQDEGHYHDRDENDRDAATGSSTASPSPVPSRKPTLWTRPTATTSGGKQARKKWAMSWSLLSLWI